jgi:hypothetical protein
MIAPVLNTKAVALFLGLEEQSLARMRFPWTGLGYIDPSASFVDGSL